MVEYRFKLMASMDPDKRIDVPPNATAAQVAERVKREFHLNPALKVKLMFEGRTVDEDYEWSRLIINPRKDIVKVMAVAPK